MTTEARLERLEEVMVAVAGTAQRHQEMLERHQELFGRIASISQRQQRQLDDIVGIIERQQEQLAEMREDAKMTRRLWVRLAAKYGWLDDEDVDGDGA